MLLFVECDLGASRFPRWNVFFRLLLADYCNWNSYDPFVFPMPPHSFTAAMSRMIWNISTFFWDLKISKLWYCFPHLAVMLILIDGTLETVFYSDKSCQSPINRISGTFCAGGHLLPSCTGISNAPDSNLEVRACVCAWASWWVHKWVGECASEWEGVGGWASEWLRWFRWVSRSVCLCVSGH